MNGNSHSDIWREKKLSLKAYVWGGWSILRRLRSRFWGEWSIFGAGVKAGPIQRKKVEEEMAEKHAWEMVQAEKGSSKDFSSFRDTHRCGILGEAQEGLNACRCISSACSYLPWLLSTVARLWRPIVQVSSTHQMNSRIPWYSVRWIVPYYSLLFQHGKVGQHLQPTNPVGERKLSVSSYAPRSARWCRERFTAEEGRLLINLKETDVPPWEKQLHMDTNPLSLNPSASAGLNFDLRIMPLAHGWFHWTLKELS